MRDVIIIGAGVSGACVARELSAYKLDICVLDKESDICEGTSKANSAIVHGGFDALPGTLNAKLNVWGTSIMEDMAKELDFSFKRNGSLLVCQGPDEVEGLEKLLARGETNGVKGMEILDRAAALEKEPNLSDTVYAALYVPSAGIVCPFGMNIAYAENAAVNGVEFKLNTTVEAIEKIDGGYLVKTDKGDMETKYVINAAGVYADVFHNMVSDKKIHITARRGSYCLLDKTAGAHVSHTIFQLPSKMGKGILVTPTVHGNLLMGPTAVDVEDKEAVNTTADEISQVLTISQKSVKDVPTRQVITSFAGLRAHEDGGEFIIGEVEDAPGFIDVAGIESPGLSSAPAIGLYVRDIFVEMAKPEKKDDFVATRKGIVNFIELSSEEKNNLIKELSAKIESGNNTETETYDKLQELQEKKLALSTRQKKFFEIREELSAEIDRILIQESAAQGASKQ